MYKPPSLDGLRSSAKKQPEMPPQLPEDPELLQGTRWLYDTESEFRKAQKKLKAEEAHDQLKKQLAKKVRVSKTKNLVARLLKLLVVAPTALSNYIRRIATNPSRHKLALTLTVLAIAVLTTLTLLKDNTNTAQPVNADSQQVLSSNLPTSPTFTTLAPGGDIHQATGGELRYDSAKQVASYTDTVQNVAITVSQQELPGHFVLDPAAGMANLASSINSKDQFNVGDTTVYVGQPNNTQTAVFMKNQVLVFIVAQTPLSNEVLAAYINGLR